jgi:thymidylate synthase
MQSNPFDIKYLEILDQITTQGQRQPNRTGTDTISLFGLSYRLPVRANWFPILTHKKIFWRSLVAEIIWYLNGESHIRNLQQHTKIWDAWSDADGNLETAYGRFWRHYPISGAHGGEPVTATEALISANIDENLKYLRYLPGTSLPTFDQLRWVVDELRRNPYSRRLHVTAWYPPNACASRLPPCHHSFTLNYQAGKVNLHLQQRSLDACLGAPFNFSCYSLLLLLICREVGLEPGEFYHSITDAHVYVNHLDAYKSADRRDYTPPQLDLNDLGMTSMFDLTYDHIDAIKLIGYQHGPVIKLPVAV